MQRWMRGLLLTLVLALFVAPIAGAAMVPDPTWIGGVYDGGDGDEVAILVWDRTSAVVPVIAALPSPAGALFLEPPAPVVVVSTQLPQPASRAPPRG